MRIATVVVVGVVIGAVLVRKGVVGDLVSRLTGSRVVRVR